MARQVEPECSTWALARLSARRLLRDAVAGGDFAAVPADPYADQDPGETGYPACPEIEQKLVDAYANQSADVTSNDQIGLLLQADILQSYRRARLAGRQGKREILNHLRFELVQADRYDDLLLQTISGTAKVPTRTS